jgi:group I intron endonuclease
MYTVYRHTTPNGKVYIGITKQKPEKRWNNGNGYKNNEHFYRAIQNYGWENIKHEIICQAPLSAAQAGAIEKSFIHLYDSTNPDKGYNHSTGGEYGALGMHHSIESRRKISEGNKGKHLSAETRRKIGEANKGKKPSAECIRKSIEMHKGKHLSDEHRKKIGEAEKGVNNPNYGKHQSAETRQKISESLKGNIPWNKGKHLSQEERRKVSEYLKGKTTKAVICIETGTLYSSVTEAAKSIGIAKSNIAAVCRHRRETTGGYHWKYADMQKYMEESC